MNAKYKKLMTHRATVHKIKRNSEGDWVPVETFANVPCFFQWGKKIVTDLKGEEVTAAAIVFMQDDCPITDDDHSYWKITQTAPYERAETKVIRADPLDDPRNGKTHHFEVAVQ